MGLTLKKFLKYYNDIWDIKIMQFPRGDEDGAVLFDGTTYKKKDKKKLEKLCKQGYELEINEDGTAIMLYPYRNKYGANLCSVQINVKKKGDKNA